VTLPPFQSLVDAHWRDVSRLAHALAGPVDGDDVAQQAWTQALAAYPRLRSRTNLRGWLLTITSPVRWMFIAPEAGERYRPGTSSPSVKSAVVRL
jgi:Sigma-70 region 2